MRFLPLTIAFVLSLYGLNCSGQSDTIIVYTPSTQLVDTILPVVFDTTLEAGHTPSSEGSVVGLDSLPTDFPTTNLLTGVEHTFMEHASNWFNVGDYPVRAAIKLARESADTLQHVCSGMMVSRSFVLTASHCVLDFQDGTFYDDGILAFPGYDMGEENLQIPSSAVERVYVFKRNLGNSTQMGYDIALVELADPIGDQSGWIGIGFESDDFIESNIFHKFSYPGWPLPFDTVGNYNGDTMYYDYGSMNVLPPFAGIDSPDAAGIPGQSGSSMFVVNGTDLYSLGVLSWSTGYRHTRVTNNIYHQFKPLLENDQLASSIAQVEVGQFKGYPNPTEGDITVDLGPEHSSIAGTLSIYDMTGKLLNSTVITSELERLSLPEREGVYLIQLIDKEGGVWSRRVVRY